MSSVTKFLIFLNFFFAGFNAWGLINSIYTGKIGWVVLQTIVVILGTCAGFFVLKDDK